MNHFKRVSDRISWCEFKRLQSTLSAPASKIQIPRRIKRGPTDILCALERTIPKDSMNHNYLYHDDPFLLPQTKVDYRNYALSYEAGKKAAMWIHREHADLFPTHLSEPEIKAFKPVTKYTDKSQVSNEILSQSIAEYRVSDAIDIYSLLGTSTSNETKQELLELLCFYNNESMSLIDSPSERFFTRPDVKPVWQITPLIQELYESLIQDPSTAAAAYNTMICGLAKYLRAEEAIKLYHECKEKDIPLNVTTYNYILALLPEIYGKKSTAKIDFMYDLLRSMNVKGVKPNVRTLNSALKAVMLFDSKDIIKQLITEFKRMDIKFSLATYYYILFVYTQKDDVNSNYLKDILRMIQNKSFSIQDPDDGQFFVHAMYLANHYFDRVAGDMIHSLLLTGENQKFISSALLENMYYNSYLSLLLSTSPIDEYFEIYGELVPRVYVPKKGLIKKMIDELNRNTNEIKTKHLPKLWTDLNTYCVQEMPLKLSVINMMKTVVSSTDSKTSFADAAWDCWKRIKSELEEKLQNQAPIETAILGSIALILLRGDRVEESIEVLKSTAEQSDLFIPTMSQEQVNELFEAYISQQCIQGAMLVLEYSANSGFPHVVDMAMKLHNLPQLTKVERDRLAHLVGVENSCTWDASKSN